MILIFAVLEDSLPGRGDYGIDLDGGDFCTVTGTRIWEVELGGCVTVWVSARNHVQAIRVAGDSDHLDGVPWDDEISITAVSSKRAAELTFTDEDGERRPMIEQWRRNTSPGVIACSEY